MTTITITVILIQIAMMIAAVYLAIYLTNRELDRMQADCDRRNEWARQQVDAWNLAHPNYKKRHSCGGWMIE